MLVLFIALFYFKEYVFKADGVAIIILFEASCAKYLQSSHFAFLLTMMYTFFADESAFVNCYSQLCVLPLLHTRHFL